MCNQKLLDVEYAIIKLYDLSKMRQGKIEKGI